MDRRVTPPTWGPPPPCKQALIRPLAATHFVVKEKLRGFGVRSREQLLPDKFEDSYYLSAGCKDILGRSYIFITSWS